MNKIELEKLRKKYKHVIEESRISILSATCSRCLHYREGKRARRRCGAFPNGIPIEIWETERNHDEPYPNDNGIHFKHFKGKPITSQNIIDEIKQRRSE